MKQFLMVCDEEGLTAISRVCGSVVKFIEVSGMQTPEGKFNVLVTPNFQSGGDNGEQSAKGATLPEIAGMETAVCDGSKT